MTRKDEPKFMTAKTLALIIVVAFFAAVATTYILNTDRIQEAYEIQEALETETITEKLLFTEKDWYMSGVGGYVEGTYLHFEETVVYLSGDYDIPTGVIYTISWNTRTGKLYKLSEVT